MAFNIRTRIRIALVIGIGLLAGSVAASVYQYVQMDRGMAAIEVITEEIEMVSQLQLAMDKALMPPNDYLITGQNDKGEEFRRRAVAVENLLERIRAFALPEEEKRILLTRIQGSYEQLKALAEEILTLSDPIKSPQGPPLMKQLDATGQEVILLLDQYHLIDHHELDEVRVDAALLRQRMLWHLMGSGTILGVFALFFGLRLVRSIIRPMQELENGTERIAAGDWEHRVDIRTGDELEALAWRFNGMAEKLGGTYRSLESQVIDRTRQIAEQLNDLANLLETSAGLSATVDMDRLLALIAERMTHTIQVTYCRIALFEEDHPDPVIRAAYSIRELKWEPGIGTVLEFRQFPTFKKALETNQYVILSPEELARSEYTPEREHLLTPETQSALIFPLVLDDRPLGAIILGETRRWEREPFSQEKIILCQTMANQASVAIANARNYFDLQEMFTATVSALASAIDAKSPWTRGHSERVTHYAVTTGKRLGLDIPTLNHLRLGCLLHDIGKIGTDEGILEKPAALTDDEMAIIKKHPVKGEEILRPIRQFKPILPVIRHHHERFDGKGYPDGLQGEAIPFLARIVAVADTYDSMTADRPYRKALSREKAIAEIKRCAGTQFDASIAEVFIAALETGISEVTFIGE